MKQTLLQLCAFATLTVGFISFVGCTGEAPKKEEPKAEQPAEQQAQPAAADTAAAAHEHAPGDTTHKH
jgi:hypothetical protein